jgi:hypothetical protein
MRKCFDIKNHHTVLQHLLLQLYKIRQELQVMNLRRRKSRTNNGLARIALKIGAQN